MDHIAGDDNMFKSINIKNFKCYKNFAIDNLAQINLISGKNGIGKTALLEAILLQTNPNNSILPFKVNSLRKLQIISQKPEDLWGWLFHKKNIEEPIEFKAILRNEKEQVLKITVDDIGKTKLMSSENGTSGSAIIEMEKPLGSLLFELRLNYKDSEGTEGISRLSLKNNEYVGYNAEIGRFPHSAFLATYAYSVVEEVQRFSMLDEMNVIDDVLQMMKLIEPKLERLSIMFLGNTPTVAGRIDNMLIPITYMGMGISRYLQIILSIATAKGGCIIIDEIENGFHSSILVDVWKSVLRLAKENNVQIFASTHSWECIRAISKAINKTKFEDFKLHRLEVVKGKQSLTTFNANELEIALKTGFEVR